MWHNVQTGHCLGWAGRIFIDLGLSQCFQLNQKGCRAWGFRGKALLQIVQGFSSKTQLNQG